MRVIKISLYELLCLINDQDKPKDNNPKITNVFSFVLKLIEFLMKK